MPASPARGYPLQAARRAQFGHVFAAGQARAGPRFHVYPRPTCGVLVSRWSRGRGDVFVGCLRGARAVPVAWPWRCVRRLPAGCSCRAGRAAVAMWSSATCGVLVPCRSGTPVPCRRAPTAFPPRAGRRARAMVCRGPVAGRRLPSGPPAARRVPVGDLWRPVVCGAGTCGGRRMRGGDLWRPVAWPSRARMLRRAGSVAASIRRRMARLTLRAGLEMRRTLSPHSSGDRATASGAVCVGSNPTGGTFSNNVAN